MKRTTDIMTVVWIAAFVLSYVLDGWAGSIAGYVCIAAGALFVIELVLSWLRRSTAKKWLRENWCELVFLVPVFRGLRCLRAVRRSRRFMKLARFGENVFDVGDMAVQARTTLRRIWWRG